jgi:hypothetical protein
MVGNLEVDILTVGNMEVGKTTLQNIGMRSRDE